MKVLTVVGTRPEIIRLSRVMAALDRYLDHIIVHTGQNYDYELNQVFFDDLEIRKPDHFLETAGTGQSTCETIGGIIGRVDRVLEAEKPDALLVLGDTNSCLAAYPAKRRKIPVFHMEAGNRCFDQRVPEEINRKIVDHISDINMPYSTISRDYLLREGISPDRVIKTGSPMYEVLHHYMPKIEQSDILQKLELVETGNAKSTGADRELSTVSGERSTASGEPPGTEVEPSLPPAGPHHTPLTTNHSQPVRPYYLVSAHREENIGDPAQFKKLVEVLNHLGASGDRVIMTTHPRTRMQLEQNNIELPQSVELHKPFALTDYVWLQINAKAVLSDSGTITEESSILNFPALNIRNAHERPEGMEEGAVMMTGLEPSVVAEALEILEKQPRGNKRMLQMVTDYDTPNVSEKVVRIILSYTAYVNHTVWHR